MKKNNTLKNKIFRLALWLLLYSLILITVCNIVKLPAGKKQAVALHLSSVQNDIFNLRALKNDYLLVCSREYSDIESEAVFIENSFNDISKEILVKINEITPYSNLRKDSSWVSELSKLTANILLFSDHSARLFDTFREMGNSGSGLISQWIKTSDLLAANTDQNNRGLSGRLAEIKRLESSYLLTFDPRNTSEIISICDDMSSLFKDNDSELYGPLLSEYVSLTVKIHETGNRIYNNGDNSLLKEADRDYEAAVGNLTVLTSLNSNSRNVMAGLTGYLVIALMFTSGIWFLAVCAGKTLVVPLLKAEKFAGEIAKGSGSDMVLREEGTNEIRGITEKLNAIAARLANTYRFLQSMNKGDFNSELKVDDDSDILGNELLKTRTRTVKTAEEQSRTNEETMKRRYITEGLAKFAGFMRAGDNLKSMGDNFIRNLVRYLDAVQGGLFLLEEGDDRPYLNLLAAFAYDRKKFFEKRIEIGEGLIGTCAIEKNTINITEVPEGYISITSGLGDTPPENLLLIPVIYEGELLGVVEVASLRRFLDHEIKFAEEVAKNLGSTIVYTRNSEITSTLLGKSQQQALEMAEQEEEMRQNMEELKATQEESARREEEYKSLIRALDMSFHIIEYDAETGLVSDVNELTCKLMGSGRDYFTGKTHQQIFNSSLNTDKAFRAKVNNDKIVVETEDVEIKGKKIKLKHRFSPVHNSSGTLVKYVNFVTVEDKVIKD